MSKKSILGEEIKKLRTMRGLSQQMLADTVETTVTSISGIERGRHLPRPAMLKRIAEALDVPIDVLRAFAAGVQPSEIASGINFQTLRQSITQPRLSTNEESGAIFTCIISKNEQVQLSISGRKDDILSYVNMKLSIPFDQNEVIVIKPNADNHLDELVKYFTQK